MNPCLCRKDVICSPNIFKYHIISIRPYYIFFFQITWKKLWKQIQTIQTYIHIWALKNHLCICTLALYSFWQRKCLHLNIYLDYKDLSIKQHCMDRFYLQLHKKWSFPFSIKSFLSKHNKISWKFQICSYPSEKHLLREFIFL